MFKKYPGSSHAILQNQQKYESLSETFMTFYLVLKKGDKTNLITSFLVDSNNVADIS